MMKKSTILGTEREEHCLVFVKINKYYFIFYFLFSKRFINLISLLKLIQYFILIFFFFEKTYFIVWQL